eukprot:7431077-Pyramimonas_sp.AAC.1
MKYVAMTRFVGSAFVVQEPWRLKMRRVAGATIRATNCLRHRRHHVVSTAAETTALMLPQCTHRLIVAARSSSRPPSG